MAAGRGTIITLKSCHADAGYVNCGEPVRYATEEDAKRSIKENRALLAYFGIKEWNNA